MDVRERDVEDLFYKFGRIREIDLKTPMRPPAYAFISFEDFRDAQDAVRERCVVLALLLLQPHVKGWQFQGVRSCSMALRRDVVGRDGYEFDGNRLRVELAKGSRGADRGGYDGGRGGYGGGGAYMDRGRGGGGGGGGGGGRRTDYQVGGVQLQGLVVGRVLIQGSCCRCRSCCVR